MKKLLFKIKNNALIVKEKVKLNENYQNLLNTNVISCDELMFSYDYLIENKKIVANFLSELANNYNINTIIIYKNEFVEALLDILCNNKNIVNLVLKEDTQITFKICEKLIKTNIKNVNCYNLQPFMIEYLDKYNIIVESRNEILYLSNFMLDNNLSVFSSMFYKMTLEVDLPLGPQDEEDFLAFCTINKYLKTINVNSVNKSDLEYIVKILRKNNKKNIKINIHENISDDDTINYLREFNKKKSKRYKIYFRLVYSNEYLKDNLLKQTNNNILKTCGYIIILIIAFTFGYIFYDNYTSMEQVNKINDEIKNNISLSDEDVNIKFNEEINNEKKTINKDVASVYLINPETVGWVKVNNTNIDYPVVQATNNEYYLNHNIYRENDKNGWVFMDFRSDLVNLSDNVVLYAHNRYYNGIMFGNLQNMMRYNWYSKEENQIISVKSLYNEYHYKIFSLYKVETTLDYLQVIFPDKISKMKMFELIKSRSIYDFGITLNEDDKILTLSTCADSYSKYVVHAVLIDEEKRN